VVDLPQAAFLDQLFREGNRGYLPIVKEDGVVNTRLSHGVQHGLSFGGGVGEGFLTKDVLAGLGGRDDHFGM
jgi:hypothetical protein